MFILFRDLQIVHDPVWWRTLMVAVLSINLDSDINECITSGIKMRSKQLAKLSKKYQDEKKRVYRFTKPLKEKGRRKNE